MKSMKGFRHINDFFMRKENNAVTMATSLIRWNTARMMHNRLGRYKSIDLELLQQLPELSNKLYGCRNYIEANFKEHNQNHTKEMHEELIQLMDKLGTIQRFAEDNPEDVETIGEMIKQVSGMEAETVLSYHPMWAKLAEEVADALADLSLFRWLDVPDNDAGKAEMQADIANFISVKGIRDL
jgi:hypothetical protein